MYISNAVMPETSEKNGGGAVVIDGHKLPYPVGIGLNDLPNIGGASGPPGPPGSGITEMYIRNKIPTYPC